MDTRKMLRPQRLIPGKTYWLLLNTDKQRDIWGKNIQAVVFRCYRPHPAEVVVKRGDKSEVVARKNIFFRIDPGSSKKG